VLRKQQRGITYRLEKSSISVARVRRTHLVQRRPPLLSLTGIDIKVSQHAERAAACPGAAPTRVAWDDDLLFEGFAGRLSPAEGIFCGRISGPAPEWTGVDRIVAAYGCGANAVAHVALPPSLRASEAHTNCQQRFVLPLGGMRLAVCHER
jgi:hypothetical protein